MPFRISPTTLEAPHFCFSSSLHSCCCHLCNFILTLIICWLLHRHFKWLKLVFARDQTIDHFFLFVFTQDLNRLPWHDFVFIRNNLLVGLGVEEENVEGTYFKRRGGNAAQALKRKGSLHLKMPISLGKKSASSLSQQLMPDLRLLFQTANCLWIDQELKFLQLQHKISTDKELFLKKYFIFKNM